MLITGFAAGPLAANCYVAAVRDDADCVVIDPGQQAVGPLRDMLAAHRLRPAAVLATHGHFDHVLCAAEVCAEFGAPVYLGGGDVPLLTGQLASLSPGFAAAMTEILGPGEDLTDMRPRELVALGGGEHLRVAGLDIVVLAVPGHTSGSTAFRLMAGGAADPGASSEPAGPAEPDIVFTGDTLFAGTIGRTDLPGGSMSLILKSIAAQLLSLPDETVVLPGHGAATTIGAERRGNPFLAGL